MASATQSAADQPTTQESAAPLTASGEIARESRDWESRPDLSNEINERDTGGKPIPRGREPL
jgi:hypothetical protein